MLGLFGCAANAGFRLHPAGDAGIREECFENSQIGIGIHIQIQGAGL